jgi:two-component system, LuxR family, response regulator FixJ
MTSYEPTVFVVDDDDAVRESLSWLIESVGLRVETYASPREFLAAYDPVRPGCLVLDVRMPGMSGLDLQDRLAPLQNPPPTIIITGHGDVPMAVRAMKAGAVDFIEKPFNDQVLLDCIQRALERDDQNRRRQMRRASVGTLLAQLTPREREVMDRMVAGMPNKAMAADLGISVKTVEAHRAKVMEKMQAESLSELVRMVLTTLKEAK